MCCSNNCNLTYIHAQLACMHSFQNMHIMQIHNHTHAQVGEFYEAVGMDAVLLMEFCALNPMGSPDKASNKDEFVPRAGCRVEAVVRVLKDLTTAGFHVVGPVTSLMSSVTL